MAAGVLDRHLRGGEVLDPDAQRAEQRELVLAGAPGWAPATTSPSSARMCSSPAINPSSTASLNSPASLRTDSRLSQNSAAAATVAGSISQAVGELAPTALT